MNNIGRIIIYDSHDIGILIADKRLKDHLVLIFMNYSHYGIDIWSANETRMELI